MATDRIKLLVEIDLPSWGCISQERLAEMVAQAFDYLNATASVVRPETADPLHPQHNEGEE